jgi:6-phosphogluconolactonase
VRIFVGTYTKQEGHVDGKAEGVYSCDFDDTTGEIRQLCLPAPSVNPSYLAIHPNGKHLYAANEMFEDLCNPHATFSAFNISSDGSLVEINTVSSDGIAPCYVTTDRAGRFLYGVNYQSGRVTVCAIREDGGLDNVFQMIQHEGSGPLRGQGGPHTHSIYLDSDEAYAIVPDKGADRVCVYSVRSSNGKLTNASCLDLPSGAGPRHFAWHPVGRWGYVINELNSTITSCLWNEGKLVPFETVSTLPNGFEGRNSTADIHITPDGRFLYGSNRGHNSLAAYHIDSTTGALVPMVHVSSGGEVPRGFAIDPTGRWLLCANQNSDNITVFRIDPEGGELVVSSNFDIQTPVCIKFQVTE